MNEPPVECCTEDSPYRSTPDVDVWVFPSFLDLHSTHFHGLRTGAQCGHPKESGAYTGDISMSMLANQKYISVLCGHSERRQHHNESDDFIAEQMHAALEVGLQPILCVGETADEREQGRAKEIISRQIKAILLLTPDSSLLTPLVIAYEPVWAIGTGKTATPADAEEMHTFIRSLLPKDIAESIRIIYGGSVKPENATEILKQPNIDGALVGGASLDPKSFQSIIDCLPS